MEEVVYLIEIKVSASSTTNYTGVMYWSGLDWVEDPYLARDWETYEGAIKFMDQLKKIKPNLNCEVNAHMFT